MQGVEDDIGVPEKHVINFFCPKVYKNIENMVLRDFYLLKMVYLTIFTGGILHVSVEY